MSEKNQKSKYPNLYKRPRQEWWTYRKYSSVKGREFVLTLTGISSEAKAYAAGVSAFNDWIKSEVKTTSGGDRIEGLALDVLAMKKVMRLATQKSADNIINNHIIPAFGHLKPDHVTVGAWSEYVARVQAEYPDFSFFNIRKYLSQILSYSKSKGLLKEVPRFSLPDSQPAPPRYLTRHEIRAILRESPLEIKLLLFIAWKQGARPGEVLQYRWSMIRWNEGGHGTISIPGKITKTKRSRVIPLNSRVSRVLKALRKKIDSRELLSDPDPLVRLFSARRAVSDFIFPARNNPQKHRTMLRNGWSDMLRRASCRMHRCCGPCKHPMIEAVMYNFRDTFITDKLSEGISSVYVAKYVDSSTKEIEKRYAVERRSTMEGIAG